MKKADYISQYEDRTRRSRNLFERARKVMPGGISHRYRYIAPYPFFMRRGDGARIWDEDGNEYIDLWMGHFAHILGHNSPVFKEALSEVAKTGTHWGIVHEYQVRYAELIQKIVPCAEQMVFGVSGTEATMYAVRLARAFTGKSIILKVAGGWHGGNSELAWAVRNPFNKPESAGLAPGIGTFTRAISYNDPEATLQTIHSIRDDFACVIVEPVLGGSGFISAEPSYLRLLREETQRSGALLIFDEVITGGRLALGGAQEYYGIKPDLVTLGKVFGGGTNLGVIAGRADILALGDTTIKKEKGTGVLLGGGTFSCSPLSMIVGYGIIEYLRTHESDVYPSINFKGQRLREGTVRALEKHGIVAKTTGLGSLYGLYLPHDPTSVIQNPEELEDLTNLERVEQEFKIRMLNHGVFVVHGGGALSTAHNEKDIERVIAAADEVGAEMAAEEM